MRKGDRVAPDALSPQSVALIVKQHAARAGLDPQRFAGHSLRSGFLTTAAHNGASVLKLQEVSRHKSLNVLQRYARPAKLFERHAGTGVLGVPARDTD